MSEESHLLVTIEAMPTSLGYDHLYPSEFKPAGSSGGSVDCLHNVTGHVPHIKPPF